VEVRYNIDGTVREETRLEKMEREAALAARSGRRSAFRQETPIQHWFPPMPRHELLKQARDAVSPLPPSSSNHLRSSHSSGPVSSSSSNKEVAVHIPWGVLADKILFGRNGEAPFKRGTGEFDEFKGIIQDIQYKLAVVC
jgi:hypothetical protein